MSRKEKRKIQRAGREYAYISKMKDKTISCSTFISQLQKIHGTNFNQAKSHADFYYKLKERYGFFGPW